MLDRQASDGADFLDQNMVRKEEELQAVIFSQTCCRNTTWPEISAGWLGYLIAGFIGAVILIVVARAIEMGATGDDINQLINVVRLSGPIIANQRRSQLFPGSAIPHSKSMESS
jgi:hypothetical protein